ncbi:hypothetical protein RRG08_025735 [Elysia crispata]|uniref:SPARC-related modular calcium-binding protein 1 n=1 Tax=Elysia crispata TaxID=231223 RepID=A0AAE1DYY7_9GAST|nr:hypothetical protein RRG08_025735 [Elysia crispata]
MTSVPHDVCLMTSLFLAFMLISQFGPVTAVDPRKVDGKTLFQSLRASKCSVSCERARPRPVCGTNDVTYSSRCELKKAKKCDGLRVRVKHKGQCSQEPVHPNAKCLVERQKSSKARRKDNQILVPSCKSDGTFNEIQCHARTGYCWCVTEDGKHIPGSSVKGRRPNCRGRRGSHRAGQRRSKRKRKCSGKDRQIFNTALIKVFEEEYLRVHPTPAPGSEGAEEYGTEKAIVLWKFEELDKNKDNILKFKEVRNFGRIVKKLIQPRACAKRFVRYCDKVKDRKIEKPEWTLCLGVDIKPDQEAGAPSAARPPISLDRIAEELLAGGSNPLRPSGRQTELAPEPPHGVGTLNKTDRGKSFTCFDGKRDAQTLYSQEPNAKHYIPACQSNGMWEKAQCHKETGYCWCVQENTGTPIPGTATYRVKPDCSFENERELKDCPFETKRRFLVDLMGDLTEERKAALLAEDSKSNTGPEDNLSLRETVARWKLKNLDENKNWVLDRKEWRPLRRTTLKNRKYPRKCRRNFVRYCDEDGNRKITYEEWKSCLGLNDLLGLSPENNFNSLPLNPKRKGKNPFVDQLT